MTPAELADFFEKNPGAWCQGVGARDANGIVTLYASERAVQWCLYGATVKFRVSYEEVWRRVGEDSLVDWNDKPGRTVKEVIEMLRK